MLVLYPKSFCMSFTQWIAIVNPKARSGEVLRDWPYISDLMVTNGIKFDTIFTEHKYHAVELTIQKLKEGYRKIIVVGGDGTVHEVVNGIFLQKEVPTNEVTMGVIPAGSGNDWSKMYGIVPEYYQSILSLLKERTVLQDVGKITYNDSGVSNVRYMANIAGVGYDPMVCLYTNRKKEKGKDNKMVYVNSAMKALITRRHSKCEVMLDDQPFFKGSIFSIALGIGRYSGSGMTQMPDAIVDDGEINITIISRMPKLKVLINFPKLFAEGIYRINGVFHSKGKKIHIDTENHDLLEIDGEVVGTTPVDVEVIPISLNVVVGIDFK